MAAYRKKHPEKIRAYGRRSYLKNREKLLARNRAYQHRNKEQLNQKAKARRPRYRQRINSWRAKWRSENRERYLASVKRPRRANPEKYRAINRASYWRNVEKRRADSRKYSWAKNVRRRARLRSVLIDERGMPAWIARVRAMPLVRCYYCEAVVPGAAIELDHITPISRSGPHSLMNLCASCKSCNRRKHAKTPAEWPESGQLILNI
jgi:5-methylcytosine-specific restriction endonuclease McrA